MMDFLLLIGIIFGGVLLLGIAGVVGELLLEYAMEDEDPQDCQEDWKKAA